MKSIKVFASYKTRPAVRYIPLRGDAAAIRAISSGISSCHKKIGIRSLIEKLP